MTQTAKSNLSDVWTTGHPGVTTSPNQSGVVAAHGLILGSTREGIGVGPEATKSRITLDSAVCPACAVAIPKRNRGCPHCGYTMAHTIHGRIGTLREMIAAPTGQFNNVSPEFLRLIAAAAATDGRVE